MTPALSTDENTLKIGAKTMLFVAFDMSDLMAEPCEMCDAKGICNPEILCMPQEREDKKNGIYKLSAL